MTAARRVSSRLLRRSQAGCGHISVSAACVWRVTPTVLGDRLSWKAPAPTSDGGAAIRGRCPLVDRDAGGGGEPAAQVEPRDLEDVLGREGLRCCSRQRGVMNAVSALPEDPRGAPEDFGELAVGSGGGWRRGGRGRRTSGRWWSWSWSFVVWRASRGDRGRHCRTGALSGHAVGVIGGRVVVRYWSSPVASEGTS